MCRILLLYSCLFGLLSMSGCKAKSRYSTADLVDTVFRSANREESVRIHSETELFYVKDDTRLRGSYTLVDGTRLNAEFLIQGEKVLRTFALGEKGLTTQDGTLLVREIKGEFESDRQVTKSFIAKENVYTEVSMQVLGAYLGDHYKDKKLVVIMCIEGLEERDTMFLDALNVGIKDRLTVEVAKIGGMVIPEEADATIVSPELLIQAKDFDDLMAEHKDADVFLSLAGLPDDFLEMRFWTLTDAERPALALANVHISPLRKVIQQGKVTVVLYLNPDAVYDPQDPSFKDPKKAFDERYILIDKDNVDAVGKTWPGLFKEEPEQH